MSQANIPHGLSRLDPPAHTNPPGTARLDRVLRDATRRWRSAKLLAVLLASVALLIVALLVGIALDALLGLPAWGLVAIDTTLIAVALGGLIRFVRTARRSRHDARRTAVALEQRGGAEPSRLINALELAKDGGDHGRQMSPTLRQIAVAQGESAAGRLDAGALVDRPARRKAWWSFVAAAAIFLTAWLGMPHVFDAVGPRLLSPLSDLPAYTTLRFDVAVGPELISVGKPGVVEVTLSREFGRTPLPTEADVVVLTADGQKQSSPMHRSFREDDIPPAPAGATAEQLAALPEPPTRFSLRFERIDEPMAFYIDTPDGRSPTYTITPDTAPLFESLHATVTPPDYAGFAPTTQRLQVDEAGVAENVVKALRGSAVTLTATSNVPLSEISLDPDASSGLPAAAVDPSAPLTAETMVTVDQATNYALTLVGVDGRTSAYAVTFDLSALDDRAPSVDIHSPEPLAFAVEGYPVPIRVVAKDDVGVASLTLHLNVADQDATPIELAPQRTADAPLAALETRVAATHELDLAALDAKPGDTIRYFATARDRLPTALGGPPHDAGQLAETPSYQIQIISQEEWDEIARTQYSLDQMQAEVEAFMDELHKLAEDRAQIVEQLAALREKIEAGEPLTDLERQQMQDLQEQLDAFAEDARALAEAMNERAEVPAVYEFEKPFQERLKALAAQLERQAELAEAMKDAAAPMAGMGEPSEPGESGESQEPGEANAADPGDPQEAEPQAAEAGEPSDPGDPKDPGDPGQPSDPSASADQSPQPPSPDRPGLPGVTPTQIDEFLEKAEQLAEEDQPFDEETEEEMEEFEEDLLKLELAEEMIYHAERMREVIVQQREVETKLGELRFRDPDQLSADETQRLVAYGQQEIEMRDELEDAALMLRESAELAGPLLPMMSGTSIMLTEKLDELVVYPDMEQAGAYAQDLVAPMAHASAQVAADKLESLLSDVSSMPGQAEQDLGGLDGILNLPKTNLQNALQQMAQARAAGAMGQMPGSQGSPGSSGSSGSSGGRANASLIGPRSMGNAPSNAGSGRDATGRSNRATPGENFDPDAGDAESLNPDSTDTRGRSALALPGVPARYQDVAAAYFQRLADEAARENRD